VQFFYLANVRLPTEKAHGLQIIQMCSAFAEAGVKVILVAPRRLQTHNLAKQELFQFYNLPQNFQVKYLPCIDLIKLKIPHLLFWLQSFTFTITAFFYLLFHAKKNDIIYTRHLLIAWPLLLFTRSKIFYEAHDFPNQGQKIFSWLIKHAQSVITISQGLTKVFQQIIPTEKILTAPDSVDLKRFTINLTTRQAREKLNLPLEKKLLIYTGHFYKWKGVDILVPTF